MKIRSTLLRGAAVFSLAAAIVGTSALVPVASAAPQTDTGDLTTVLAKKSGKQNNDNSGRSGSGNGIGDVPIIGDVVNGFQNAEPEEIATGAIELVGGAAETVVPLIIRLTK